MRVEIQEYNFRFRETFSRPYFPFKILNMLSPTYDTLMPRQVRLENNYFMSEIRGTITKTITLQSSPRKQLACLQVVDVVSPRNTIRRHIGRTWDRSGPRDKTTVWGVGRVFLSLLSPPPSPRSLCRPSTRPRPSRANRRWRPHYEFRFFRPSNHLRAG